MSGNTVVYLVHDVLLLTQSLGLPVFVSEPKILVKGDFETVKARYIFKIRRQGCIER